MTAAFVIAAVCGAIAAALIIRDGRKQRPATKTVPASELRDAELQRPIAAEEESW